MFLHRILSFLRAASRRSRFESEMDTELRTHMQAFRDDLIAQGVAPDEAGRRARLEFGAVESVKDECRESKGLAWPDAVRRDLLFAVRVLRKSPAFALGAILTLALCIGANTAIFSVVDAVLFRPLPYPRPDRLALVGTAHHSAHGDYEQTAQDGRAWEYLRENVRTLDLAVYSSGASGVNLAQPGAAPRYVRQQRVSAGFFHVLGVAPLIGREIDPEEDRPGGSAAAVAILSHALWSRAFASSPLLIGGKIMLRGEPFVVIGIMPEGFQTTPPADLWTPLMPSIKGEGGGTNYTVTARVRPGFERSQAGAELATVGTQLFATMKHEPGVTSRLHLVSLQRGLNASILSPLLFLWAAVILVLLIGCVNVAGLMLARGVTRTHEIATRMALGSGRPAILRQLLVESVLLSLAGAAVGLVLGYAALAGMKNTLLEPLGFYQPLTVNLRVMLAMAAAALLTSLIFGLYPAFETTRVDIRSALTASGRTASQQRGPWARRLLIIAEVALGMMLLVSAGLILRTLSFLTALQPGYDGRNVLAASLSLQDARYTTAAAIGSLFQKSLDNIRSQPGIESAGIGLTLPYERALNDMMRVIDGPRAMEKPQITNLTYVTPGYFEALRIPLRQGRLFTAGDTASSQPVVAVNEAFARMYLRGDVPLGRHIGSGDSKSEIVALVGDVQEQPGWGSYGPVTPVPEIYVPASQVDDATFRLIHTWFSPKWVVRSARSQAETIASIERAVESVDPQLPFAKFQTMEEIRSGAFGLQRLETVLLGMLASLALMLVAVGVFGLIAHSVVERRREFGIRLALGSTTWQAIGMATRPGILLTAAGILIGFLLSRAASQVIESLLWGVRSSDPLTFAIVAFTLLFTAALASVLPSLRIARMDPVRTLREQ